VDLLEIRLSALTAKRIHGPSGTVTPEFSHGCVPVRAADGVIEVACTFDFRVLAAEDVQLAEANLTYLLTYALSGDEQVTDEDLKQFAFANGTYHSWPFARAAIFDLTARMGFPPYTLPIFAFAPPRPAALSTPEK